MAATSPLPRWAPTPSPSRPLWRWGGGTPDATTVAAATHGSGGWSLGSVFSWATGGGRRRRRRGGAAPNGGSPAGGGGVCVPWSGCELVAAPGPGGGGADAAVYLTWEDVEVTVAGPRGAPAVEILSGVSGYARPGEVLAIMGPSGCGKTTLLDTLAGRLGPGMDKKGLILINGRQEKLAYGTSAYVTQDNVLMSTLSVREAVYYSAQLQLPDTMPASEKRSHADRVIREMGLGDAMDTRIGGRITKGISGGQRKRVSICIEMLTRPRLLFLDEPTSGLDSAASYHVMSHIARIAVREGMTVVAAVHQPSGDVFELFHGLCLLAAGKTVFFGTISDATEIFRKERLSGHYGVSEFVISNTLSATPYLSVIALLPGAMLYYLTGLTKGVDHFVYFVIVLCICCLLVESMMMIIAVLVPDFLMGIIIGAGVQGVMMLNGGFFRLPSELPKPVWKYPCYYISFHKYAVQGFYKNEFMELSFPSDQLVESNVTISGIQVLKTKLQVEMGYSKWVNVAILCGMMVVYRLLFFIIVKITEKIRPKLGGRRGCVR
nr:unnamed protein product [Digitaria exilis]